MEHATTTAFEVNPPMEARVPPALRIARRRVDSSRQPEQCDQFKSRVPNLANAFSSIGLALLVYALVVPNVLLAVVGILIVHLGKLWYLDRMVLLFDHMKTRDDTYASWEY